MPKKILIIGMLNSIHFANWLERITEIDCEIYLFASRQYRHLHPKAKFLIKNNSSIHLVSLLPFQRLTVYFEYTLDKSWFGWVKFLSRKARLTRLIKKYEFSKIHALEIQHAGYLLVEALPRNQKFNNIIITNWGSDIYFYSKKSEHKNKIRRCLEIANYYSAECERDYYLARQFGFTGVELPVVPNSTTFPADFFNTEIKLSRERSQIIVKCYGKDFGLGNILLNIIQNILLEFRTITVFAYSVSPDLYDEAKKLVIDFPGRFRFSTVVSPVAHKVMIEEFLNSRIYIGASRSDGVSTSFLESIATGAYPIQTNTSCASEWIEFGAVGGIVSPESEAIYEHLRENINNFEFLEGAQRDNRNVARARLNFGKISETTRTFYR